MPHPEDHPAMSEFTLLAIYCGLILLVSMAGGWIPLRGRVTHSRLQLYLSISAGVMLGAAFFHVMPDAKEYAGDNFGWWMSLGVVGLFCIERFIAPHSHEVDGGAGGQHHHHYHDHEHEHKHVHQPEHEPEKALEHKHELRAGEPRAAAPAVAGWMAVVGLTIHTFMNGVGLAALVNVDYKPGVWAGISMFLAIALHKPADALAISTVLSRKGVSRIWISLVQLGFALTIPLGAAAFYLLGKRLEPEDLKQLTGAALSFSAGTFLFVALSDLLPEVQFHRHDRVPLFLSLVAGVVFMGIIGYLEEHDEGQTLKGYLRQDGTVKLEGDISVPDGPVEVNLKKRNDPEADRAAAAQRRDRNAKAPNEMPRFRVDP
jgi:zinc and cadmium transporter